jgi:uncharacterized protein YkwD
MVRYGLHFHAAGENLGWFSGDSVPAMLRAINLAMMHSPVHRSNLLRPSFHQVGIGVAISGNRVFVTEDFTG